MFPQANLSVRDVIQMVNAIFLRFALPIEVRTVILLLIKILAGPAFEELNFAKYSIAKVCDPPTKPNNKQFFLFEM